MSFLNLDLYRHPSGVAFDPADPPVHEVTNPNTASVAAAMAVLTIAMFMASRSRPSVQRAIGLGIVGGLMAAADRAGFVTGAGISFVIERRDHVTSDGATRARVCRVRDSVAARAVCRRRDRRRCRRGSDHRAPPRVARRRDALSGAQA